MKVLPYFWYGFGNGGVAQKTLSETGFLNPTTGKIGAAADINGDGDTLDTIVIANASTTHTTRPGVTSSLTWSAGNHLVLGGFWVERAKHDQTGPAVRVNADGTPVDYFLQNGQILRPDGVPYQSRNWRTISTASQLFLQDTISMLDDRLTVNVGVRTPRIKRDFTNIGNEGFNSGITYQIEKTYTDVLPQLGARYKLTADDQVYASLAKNMKAPPNFLFAMTGTNVKLINGVATLVGDVKEETSYNLDVGIRHQTRAWIGSFNIYSINFSDRQATAFDPNTATSTLTNVGKVKNNGFEIEAGNTPVNGWSFYGSYGYSKSEVKDNLRVSATAFLPTGGKEMPLTPRHKAGLSVEYQDGAFWVRAKGKATSKQYATLTNDEVVPGYTVYGVDGGYTFANFGIFKRPKLQVNISNITSKQYRNPSSQSVTNALAYPGASARSVFYYLGAPRFASMTLSVDI